MAKKKFASSFAVAPRAYQPPPRNLGGILPLFSIFNAGWQHLESDNGRSNKRLAIGPTPQDVGKTLRAPAQGVDLCSEDTAPDPATRHLATTWGAGRVCSSCHPFGAAEIDGSIGSHCSNPMEKAIKQLEKMHTMGKGLGEHWRTRDSLQFRHPFGVQHPYSLHGTRSKLRRA